MSRCNFLVCSIAIIISHVVLNQFHFIFSFTSPALVKAAIDFALANPLTISGNTTFTGTVSGPTFTGTVSGPTPTLDSHLTPKSYVDQTINEKSISEIIVEGSGSYNGFNKIIKSNVDFSNYSFVIVESTLTTFEGSSIRAYIALDNYNDGDLCNVSNYGSRATSYSLFSIIVPFNNIVIFQSISKSLDVTYNMKFLNKINNINIVVGSNSASGNITCSYKVIGFIK